MVMQRVARSNLNFAGAQKKLESGYERTILRHKGEVQKSARASPSPPAVRQATPKLKKEQKVKKEQKSKASSSGDRDPHHITPRRWHTTTLLLPV